MVQGVVRQLRPKELANGKPASATPSDAPLRLAPLEMGSQKHAKVNVAWNSGTTNDLAIVGNVKIIERSIEVYLVKEPIELRVENMSIRTGLLHSRNKQVLLFSSITSTNGHTFS